jgi:ketosteroid isomerase-like protein
VADENRAVVERFIQALAHNDLDVLEATLARDVVDTYPQSGERFAEPFDAPDWRAPYREPMEA